MSGRSYCQQPRSRVTASTTDKRSGYILTATKEFTTGQYIPSGIYNYTITVTNIGSKTINDIEVIDGLVTFPNFNLAPGKSNIINGSVMLPADNTDPTFNDVFGPNGKYINVATIKSPVTANLTVEDTIYKPINVLHVSKFANAVVGDDSIVYTVTVTNNANFDITLNKDDVDDTLTVDGVEYALDPVNISGLPMPLIPGATGTYFIEFPEIPALTADSKITNKMVTIPSVGDAKYNIINTNVTTPVSGEGSISASKTTNAVSGDTLVEYVVSITNNTNADITITDPTEITDTLDIDGTDIPNPTIIGLPITIPANQNGAFIIRFSLTDALVKGNVLTDTLKIPNLGIDSQFIYIVDTASGLTCWEEHCGKYVPSDLTSAKEWTIWTPTVGNSDAIIEPTGSGSLAMKKAQHKRGPGSVDFRLLPNKEIGTQVIVGGVSNEAKGMYSFTIGDGNFNNGNNSIVCGSNNVVDDAIDGSNNLIAGLNNKATGKDNLMVGHSDVVVSGDINNPRGKYVKGDGNINGGYISGRGAIWNINLFSDTIYGSLASGYAKTGTETGTGSTSGNSYIISGEDGATSFGYVVSGNVTSSVGSSANSSGSNGLFSFRGSLTRGYGLTGDVTGNGNSKNNKSGNNLIFSRAGSLMNGCGLTGNVTGNDTSDTNTSGKNEIYSGSPGSLVNGFGFVGNVTGNGDSKKNKSGDNSISSNTSGTTVNGYVQSGDVIGSNTSVGNTSGNCDIFSSIKNGSMVTGSSKSGNIIGVNNTSGNSSIGSTSDNFASKNGGSFVNGCSETGTINASNTDTATNSTSGNSSILAYGSGSLLNGYSITGGFNTGNKQISGDSTITSYGKGSITSGYAESISSNDVLIQNKGNGSLVTGYVKNTGNITMTAASDGSVIHGVGPIAVNGKGSMTVGTNLKNNVDYCVLIGTDGNAKNPVSLGNPDNITVNGQGSLQIGCIISGSPSNTTTDICAIIGQSATVIGEGAGITDHWINAGADYAEYFELAKVNDKYPSVDELIGKFVYINDDGKAIVAQSGEDTIGIFSSALSNYGILGDAGYFRWDGMTMKDKYGRKMIKPTVRNSISRFMTIPEEYKNLDNEELLAKLNLSEENKTKVVTENMPITNPDYDSTREYVPRTCREEWRIVSMLGKIVVRDDGTCKVGKKCTCNADGIAVPGNKWVVMQRISSDTIVILFR